MAHMVASMIVGHQLAAPTPGWVGRCCAAESGEPEVIRSYRDWYGDEPVIVKTKGLVSRMPAYEAEVRWQMLGERIRFVEQVANAA